MSQTGENNSLPVIAITAAVGAVVLLIVLMCNIVRKNRDEEDNQGKEELDKKASRPQAQKQDKSKKLKYDYKNKKSQVTFTHAWLSTTLKGHGSTILDLDLSSSGKYVISASDDRSVLLWSTKTFGQKDNKFVRCNIEYDHATKIVFSPDNKAFLVSLANNNTVRIYRLGKKDDGSVGNITSAFEFEKKHKNDIINIGVPMHGKFIMTCSNDTTIIIWDIKGEVLSTIETLQMNNQFSTVSTCGRFVGSSGFTPDVKVWEVCFDKSGNYKETKRAFELKGHSAGVYHFAFNTDSTRMVTVSKDNTWRLWDTNVNYQMGQDTRLLKTIKLPTSGPSLIAVAPDTRSVAVAVANKVYFYNTQRDTVDEQMENVFSGDISCLRFDSSGKLLLVSGDKHIHVIHNITGYRAIISELVDTEKKAMGNAMKERMRKQVQEAKATLNQVLGQTNGHVRAK